jgi:type II secretory pathway component GspD/PulD (secretin)
VSASGDFGETDSGLMKIELKQVFDDVFEHLGVEVIFDPRTSEPVSIVALMKEPESVYEVGSSQVIRQVAEFSVKAADVTPKVGDLIKIIACAASTSSKKYKIHEEPLLDGSNLIFKFNAILMER